MLQIYFQRCFFSFKIRQCKVQVFQKLSFLTKEFSPSFKTRAQRMLPTIQNLTKHLPFLYNHRSFAIKYFHIFVHAFLGLFLHTIKNKLLKK